MHAQNCVVVRNENSDLHLWLKTCQGGSGNLAGCSVQNYKQFTSEQCCNKTIFISSHAHAAFVLVFSRMAADAKQEDKFTDWILTTAAISAPVLWLMQASTRDDKKKNRVLAPVLTRSCSKTKSKITDENEHCYIGPGSFSSGNLVTCDFNQKRSHQMSLYTEYRRFSVLWHCRLYCSFGWYQK